MIKTMLYYKEVVNIAPLNV